MFRRPAARAALGETNALKIRSVAGDIRRAETGRREEEREQHRLMDEIDSETVPA